MNAKLLILLIILFIIPYVSAENISIDNTTSINNNTNYDIITLEKGVYSEHDIKIKKDLTIEGSGKAEDIVIDGENNEIIKVNNDLTLTIQNITFINGFKNGNGGAISFYSTGKLIIDNCIFINNNVNIGSAGEGLGGAVYVHGEANNYVDLEILKTKFINNSAETDGGGVNSKFANTYINNCLFINNSANRDGGGISSRGLSNIIIKNSKFIENYAKEWGGAINNWLADFRINDCLFYYNNAGDHGGFISTCGSKTTILNSKIINNTALNEGELFISTKIL